MADDLDIDIKLSDKGWFWIVLTLLTLLLSIQLYTAFKAQELSNSEASCIREEFLSILNLNPDYRVTHYLTTQFFDINTLTIGDVLKLYNNSLPYSDLFLNDAIATAYNKCIN